MNLQPSNLHSILLPLSYKFLCCLSCFQLQHIQPRNYTCKIFGLILLLLNFFVFFLCMHSCLTMVKRALLPKTTCLCVLYKSYYSMTVQWTMKSPFWKIAVCDYCLGLNQHLIWKNALLFSWHCILFTKIPDIIIIKTSFTKSCTKWYNTIT